MKIELAVSIHFLHYHDLLNAKLLSRIAKESSHLLQGFSEDINTSDCLRVCYESLPPHFTLHS
jgi:hypothetical protein